MTYNCPMCKRDLRNTEENFGGGKFYLGRFHFVCAVSKHTDVSSTTCRICRDCFAGVLRMWGKELDEA